MRLCWCCFADFSSDHLQVPQDHASHRFLKKERSKSSEVQNNVAYGTEGYVASKVTTENTSSSEVSMDLPQNTYMHLPFSTHTKFSQEDYYFFGTYTYNIIFYDVHKSARDFEVQHWSKRIKL